MLTFASGFTSGFTLKEVLSFILRRHRLKREKQLDDAVVAYLIRELRSSHITVDGYGQESTPYYRRPDQIANATKQKAVAVLQRLERLEMEKRVERPAPRSDDWAVTHLELHDQKGALCMGEDG